VSNAEKASLEQDMREVYIREVQAKQIDLETRKKQLQESEGDLRKQ
jgi:hypothetical protein